MAIDDMACYRLGQPFQSEPQVARRVADEPFVAIRSEGELRAFLDDEKRVR